MATRSPSPARPISVIGLASIAIASRAVSARPRVITEAVVLSPKPSPTAIPTDERDDVLVGAAELAAHHVDAGVGPERRRVHESLEPLRDRLVGARHDRRGRLARAISLERLGPLITAMRSGPASVTSAITSLIRFSVPSSTPFISETITAASGTHGAQSSRLARNVCDGTASTTTSASASASLGVVGRRDLLGQLDAGQVVGVLAAPVDRCRTPPRAGPRA